MTFGCHTFATWFSVNINIYVIYDTRTYRVHTNTGRESARTEKIATGRAPARARAHAPCRTRLPRRGRRARAGRGAAITAAMGRR